MNEDGAARTVLAAIDASAAARPVLETAIGIAALTDATVAAVHVPEDSSPTPAALAAERRVAFHEIPGDVDVVLLHELHRRDVIVGVAGARATPAGRRPVGHTALRLLERAVKPVVVVPPEAAVVGARPPERLLVPLEGTDQTSEAVSNQLAPLLARAVELVAVHVFTTATVPPMVDHPDWGLELWGEEFRARYCPDARDVELRSGPVGARIVEAAGQAHADVVVLSWSQDASPGHAVVVRYVLEHSTVPVLLLPVGPGERAAAQR